MRKLGIALAKATGVLLMAGAVWVWISYDYPNVNPFMPGAVFATGMIGQVLNWMLVCLLAVAGFSLFTLGSKKTHAGASQDGNQQ